MIWKVLLIGLGDIGFKYDLDEPEDVIQTHARAFSLHEKFTLVGGVDPNKKNRDHFQKIYDVCTFETISEAFEKSASDVVVIASPTKFHFENLREIVSHSKPRLILMEKPATYTMEQAQNMIEISSEYSVPILINVVRRTELSVLEIKSRIDKNEIKLPCKGVVWYSKGLIHNACHFIDLLSWWLGKPEKIEVLDKGRKINEFDIEPDLRIQFSDSVIYFIAKNNEEYSYYNIELLAQNGRLTFGSGDIPIGWQAKAKENVGLEAFNEEINNELYQYQFNVVNDIERFLNKQSALLPSLEDHIETMKLVYEITSTKEKQ